MEECKVMGKYIGGGMAASILIYILLMIGLMPWSAHIFALMGVNGASECFEGDKYMQLNEDEKAVFNPNLMFMASIGACLFMDFFLVVFTCVVHGKKE